jgi:hypothetical protein
MEGHEDDRPEIQSVEACAEEAFEGLPFWVQFVPPHFLLHTVVLGKARLFRVMDLYIG